MRHKLMTGLLSIILIASFCTSELHAQDFEITPFFGYFFAGKLQVPDGDLNIKNGPNYGFLLDMNIRPDLQLEFMFNRIDTRVVLKEWRTGVTRDLFDIGETYFHLGALYEAQRFDGGILFTTFSLGATWFEPAQATMTDPDDPDVTWTLQDDWRFSIALGGGIKKYLSDRIGLRMQLRLLMPIYWASGGVWFGTGGSGLGLSAGTALIQADATIGLIIRL